MNQPRRLSRSSTDRIIAGVCGGIARHYGIDPTIVRIVFVLLGLFAGISPWVYLILWVAIPSENSTAGSFGTQVQQSLQEMQHTATTVVDQVTDKVNQLTGHASTPPTPPAPPKVADNNSGHDGPTTGPTTRL
ncbi:MAG: hypothetical protein NVSMB42_09620 [Herpetosiphon sp.]